MPAPLYNTQILRLAASIAHLGRIDAPDATAELRSNLCGSRVIVDVGVEGNVLARLGLAVSSCALGQASASLFSANAIGRSAEEITRAAHDFRAFLAGINDAVDFWPGMDILAPARAYPARHGAILLPFDAAAQAMNRAASKSAA